MQNTPDITQILADAVRVASPALRVVVPIAAISTGLSCVSSVTKMLCLGARRRPCSEAEAKALAVNLATAKKIAENSPPPFHVCDGCANCPIARDTGKTEEKCSLFGTSSCCVGMHIDERGVICE